MAKSIVKTGCFTTVFKWFWIIYFSLFIFIAVGNAFDVLFDDTDNVALADGFTIDAYDVVLDVGTDNKIDVTENITVNWYESNHHGIYKFTPRWLEYTGKDNNTIKRKSKVLNYRAIGDAYTLDVVKKKDRIKIGSANAYVPLGDKTYTIKYTYDMGKDPFKGFDELIFHAFGDYWGTEINNASIKVNMPKSIDGYKVNFFTDKYRENNVNKYVDYEINGNSLTARFSNIDYFISENKKLDKSLTVDIELPDGYFVGGSWNYGYGSLLISLVIFFLTGFTIYKWVKCGKDFKKREETIEFYPPDDLSAAEVGYIFNHKQANKKLTISLIIQLASKGYIKIDELKDKDKNIQITNLLIKPLPVKKADETVPKRAIKIKKLKNIDKNLTADEKTMMKYLFKSGREKLLESNIDEFLKVKDGLVNKGYIEIISDNEKTRYDEVKKRQLEEKEQTEKYNQEMEIYYDKLSKMPKMSKLETIVYERLFESKDEVILSEHTTFYKAFDDVEKELKDKIKDKVHDKEATKELWWAIGRSIVILILGIISYKVVEDLDPRFRILYSLAFLCNFVNLFFTIFMKRKTQYGEIITARIKGFRKFLVTAEKPKLEALVSENPHYFYNILPYTYVLNVSKKWIKKFEDIPVPEIDMGNFDYNNSYSYHLIYDNVYYPTPTYSSGSSSSSGCSSCGGGCSSCGGGCSSCGGGGSW